jgi:hypothetical protein
MASDRPTGGLFLRCKARIVGQITSTDFALAQSNSHGIVRTWDTKPLHHFLPWYTRHARFANADH